MRILSVLLLTIAAPAALAQEPASAQDRAIAATALVKPVERGSDKFGPAILVKRDGDTAWLVSRAEVVGRATRVDIVFSPGTAAAKTVRGEVVGSYGSFGSIRVTGAADLPAPLDLFTDLKPKDGAKIAVIGFDIPNMTKAPAGPVRAVAGTLKEITRNDPQFGPSTSYVLAGQFTPGDCGAVVLDESGRPIGLMPGDLVSPSTSGPLFQNSSIRVWAAGTWGEITATARSVSDTKVKLDLTVSLFTAFGPPKSATLSWGRGDRLKPVPWVAKRENEVEKHHPDARDSALTLSGTGGKVTIDVDRAKKDEVRARLAVQVKLTGPDGKSKWCYPDGMDVIFEVGKPVQYANSNKVYVVAREDPLPPAPGMTPLATSETFELKEVLKRSASLEDVRLSPEGDSLVVLDLSEGKILRVQTSDMTVQAEVNAPLNVAGLAVTPDWKSVWVVSQVPAINKEGKVEWGGQAVRYSWPDLTPGAPVALPFAPCEVAANNAGFLAYPMPNDQLGLFDGGKGAPAGRLSSGAGRGLVLHPSGRTVYFSVPNSGATRAVPMSNMPQGVENRWEVVGSAFDPRCQSAMSPDGRWLLVPSGQVLGVEEASSRTDFLKKFTIEPCVGFAFGKGCNTFFACTEDGLLREYELGQFVLKREVPIGKVLRWMSIDPGKKRLYGVAVTWDKGVKGGRGGFSGDLVAISLEKK